MKKVDSEDTEDDVRPECDFFVDDRRVLGKYYERYAAGVNLVLLEPGIAKAFPTAEAVNEALRNMMRAAKPAKRCTRKRATTGSRRTTSVTEARRPRRSS